MLLNLDLRKTLAIGPGLPPAPLLERWTASAGPHHSHTRPANHPRALQAEYRHGWVVVVVALEAPVLCILDPYFDPYSAIFSRNHRMFGRELNL